MSDIQSIPLQQLQISTLNARKTNGQRIDDLVASIAADGLLQNLTVTRGLPDIGSQLDSDQIFMVVAGGRRLRALQQLQQDGQLPASLVDGIPCRVVDDDIALDASTAENTIREQMHPADEIEAYVGLAAKGKTDLEIAVRFGQSERHVAGMRKLGAVSPILIDALRKDDLTLDQLKAFTTTDDRDLQESVFRQIGSTGYSDPDYIRACLNENELHVKHRLARFITVAAYESAGGTIRRDLFGDDAWLQDAELARRMALEKLERRAARERKKGWGWVEVSIDDPMPGNKLKRVWDQQPQPFLGVFVTIGYDGTGTRIEGPFERPGDRQRVEQGQSVPASAEEAKSIKAPPKDDLSLAQITRLKGARTAIARCKLAGNQRFMLTALAAALAIELVDGSLVGDGPVRIRSGRLNTNPDFCAGIELQQQIDDFGAGVDALRWRELLGDLRDARTIQEWLLLQPESVTDELLTFCAAQLVELDDSAGDDMAFAASAGINMAECWQPTGEWLATLRKAAVLRIVREVRGADAASALESMKKGELIAEASKLLANSGYLPEPLRTSDYALATDGSAEESDTPTSRGKKRAGKSAAAKRKGRPAKKKAAKKAARKSAGK